MKEIKIIQNDDGKITVESTGEDGSPVSIAAESIYDAIDQVKGQFGVMESEGEEEIQPPQPDENGVVSASKGKKLEDNIPMVDQKKKGMMPEKKADWSDYSM